MKEQQITKTENELISIKHTLKDISRHLSDISEQHKSLDYIVDSIDGLSDVLKHSFGAYGEPINVAVNQCLGNEVPIKIIIEEKEVITDEQREMRENYRKLKAAEKQDKKNDKIIFDITTKDGKVIHTLELEGQAAKIIEFMTFDKDIEFTKKVLNNIFDKVLLECKKSI